MSSQVAISEGEDAWVKLTLKDEAGTTLAVAAVTALYWTLYDVETGGIINSRENVLVAVDANPYHLHLTPADNVIVTSANAKELHRLELKIGYNSDRGTGLISRPDPIDLVVENLEKVT